MCCAVIRVKTTVKVLSLSHNKIGNVGAEAIADALRYFVFETFESIFFLLFVCFSSCIIKCCICQREYLPDNSRSVWKYNRRCWRNRHFTVTAVPHYLLYPDLNIRVAYLIRIYSFSLLIFYRENTTLKMVRLFSNNLSADGMAISVEDQRCQI